MKKLKIIIALTTAFIISTLTAQAQQPAKVKEYGIGIYGLNNFSLQYRWGNENRIHRLSGAIGASTSFGESIIEQLPVTLCEAAQGQVTPRVQRR